MDKIRRAEAAKENEADRSKKAQDRGSPPADYTGLAMASGVLFVILMIIVSRGLDFGHAFVDNAIILLIVLGLMCFLSCVRRS